MQKESVDLREKLEKSRAMRQQANSQQSKAPKLCSMCNRASFLKCMECDTIYCSSKCQIKDWERHQYQHGKNASVQSSSSRTPLHSRESHHKAPSSAQNRLKAAKEKDETKVGIEEQNRRLELTQHRFKSLNVSEEADNSINSAKSAEKPLSASESTVEKEKPLRDNAAVTIAIENAFTKMQEIRKFKRSVEMDKDLIDAEGFGHVFVTEVDDQAEDSILYSVMPLEVKDSYVAYKMALNETYSSGDIVEIPIEELSKFKRHMVITKIENDWVRASILNISAADKVVGLEDIDTGHKAIIKLPRGSIKIPLEQELHKAAYSFKVMFENLSETERLDRGDIVKIRITQSIPFAFSWAEIKTEEVPSGGNEQEVAKSQEQEKKSQPQRVTYESIQFKELSCGPNVQLIYLDGSILSKGLLHVTESKPENIEFLDKLCDEIFLLMKNAYCHGLKPEPRDLVLAKFTDDCFYRACCLEVYDTTAKLFYFDYGSIYTQNFSEMMELPTKFLYPCYSHSCKVKLASGKPWSSVNYEETDKKLLNKHEFHARVEKEDKKFVLTLDDSLVVFN